MDQPVLVLPNWVSEALYRDYVGWEQRVEIANAGTVYLARPDGEGGWVEMGTTSTGVELVSGGRMTGKTYTEQILARQTEQRERTPAGRWIDRNARTGVNPGAWRGGWCSGRVRWSERAIRTLADCCPRAEQRTRVLWVWASTPELQGTPEPHPMQQLAEGGRVTVDMTDGVLQRSWEQSKGMTLDG